MKRALVIDDNSVILRTWARLLARMGETVVDTAPTIEEALQCLVAHDYDLVLCDFELPDGTGAQVHEWVKDNKQYLLADAFFFHTGVEHIAKQQCGPDVRFIGKPYRPGDMERVAAQLAD